MSEAQGNDPAQVGSDVRPGPTPITAKRKSRLGPYGVLLILLVASGVTLAQLGGDELLRSTFARPRRAMDATPGGEQLATSERYRNTLRQANVGGADAATRAGQSFVATPDEASETLRDIDDKASVQAPLGPKLPPANEARADVAPDPIVEYVPVERPVYYEYRRTETVENDYSDIDALSSAMSRQAEGLRPVSGRSRLELIIEQPLYEHPDGRRVGVNARPSRQLENGTVVRTVDEQPGDGTAEPRERSSAPIDGGTYGADLDVGIRTAPNPRIDLPVPTGAMPDGYSPYGYGPTSVAASSSVLAKAGSVAYARIVNGTNSDTPGPIVAQVLRGPLRGARLIGSFTTNRETTALIVQFDQVVLDDATIIPTTAYAVDALYGELPVRSAYDPRYFQRYAPKLAGAFLRGAGAALATTGATVVGVGDSVAIVRPEASAAEAVAAGVSDVGSQLAEEVGNQGPETGLVTLYANKLVGVLFLANVERTSP